MDFEFKVWVRWEEEMVSNDRGRREVHYYVKDDRGGRDLAVVGREKSARHMSYAVPEKFFQSLSRLSDTASPSAVNSAVAALPWDLKLRSRRHVVDWLSLLVSAIERNLKEKSEDKEQLLQDQILQSFLYT